ncbi:tripartite motif-containing protein 2-like [Saccoglossus kowalevskii]|uniref:E3 ubiquitin-protein ligase TRIM71-like n=1 Tax=Saccoglossus kowalevskii TaxID=10224 RepID=A0ABM0MU79_SACKO|nr:PREDICTED: E3 ubiquitin-protein ligase TRIM71-like [Saccoglossus kowalevskii]
MAAKISVEKIDEDLLTCSVCLERYKNPKILPCHHTFCEQCLMKLKGPRSTIKCPNCREHLSVSNIRELPPSTIINSVIDIIEEQKRHRGDKTCHGCEENSSTNRCVDCAMDFCTTCTKVHSKMPVSRHHRIMTVEELEKAKLRDKSITLVSVCCTSHQDKLTELYCEKCQVPICHLCLRSNHKGHTVIDIHGAADIFFQMATDHIKLLKVKQSEANQSQINAAKRTEELSKQHLHQKQQIKKHSQENIEKLIKIIKQEENSHLCKLKTDYDKMNEEITRQMHQYETTEELLTTNTRIITCYKYFNEISKKHRGTRQEPGMFDHPLGVTINTCGDIVVADNRNERVQVIDIYGRPKSQLQFTGYSKPVRPIDVAVSVDNTYFITDGTWGFHRGNNQVIVCNQYGKVIQCFGGKELQNPRGIAINHNNGIVYVVDRDAHCIRLYEIIGFKYIKSVGIKDQGSCQFEYPMFIAVNSRGCIIVSDVGNHRIQVLTSDGVLMFAFSGRPNDKFDCLRGVTTDKNDNIYVCDANKHRVQMFNSKGEFITNIASGSDVLNTEV